MTIVYYDIEKGEHITFKNVNKIETTIDANTMYIEYYEPETISNKTMYLETSYITSITA